MELHQLLTLLALQSCRCNHLLTDFNTRNHGLDDLVEHTLLKEVEEVVLKPLLVLYLVCKLMSDVSEDEDLTLFILELDVHALEGVVNWLIVIICSALLDVLHSPLEDLAFGVLEYLVIHM